MEEASETPGPSTVAKAAPRPKAGGQAKAPTQGGVGRGLGRPGATRTPGVSAVGPRPSTNRSGPSTMRNPPGQKTLQVGDKKADSVVHKKSMEKRLGVKESQKKPSVADKDRGSVGKSDKKEPGSVRAAGDRKASAGQERKPSQGPVKSSDRNSMGPAKTDGNKEKNDNNDKSQILLAKKGNKKSLVEEKGGSLGRAGVARPGVKHSSSVSLARKKFERKIESSEVVPPEHVRGKKHATQPVPKGAISQNLFLKGDANAKKKAETSTEENVEDSTTEGAQVEVEVVGDSGDASDTETVPSQHSPTVRRQSAEVALTESLGAGGSGESLVGGSGSSGARTCPPVAVLSRSPTIPNLNIDDVSADRTGEAEDEEEGERRHLEVRLEHELPESPAYRSPIMSDSEGEEGTEQVHQSSR